MSGVAFASENESVVPKRKLMARVADKVAGMKHISRVMLVLAFLLAGALQCVAQDAASVLRAEVERLKKFAAEQHSEDPYWKDTKPQVDRSLMLAEMALAAGR